MARPVVCIFYSQEDEKEKNKLLSHLGVLQDAGLIDLWSDDRIGAGVDWEAEISQAVAQARVAILLISANFLTSDFILGKVVPTLLKRRESEGLIVFPVIAKACAWRTVDWLTKMNVRPKNRKPVWSDAGSHVDEDLASIAEEVAATIKKEKYDVVTTPAPPEMGFIEFMRTRFWAVAAWGTILLLTVLVFFTMFLHQPTPDTNPSPVPPTTNSISSGAVPQPTLDTNPSPLSPTITHMSSEAMPQPTPDLEPFPENKLGVAIADFGEGTDFKESSKGKDVSEAFYRGLSDQVRQTGLNQVVIRQLKATIHSEAEAKEFGHELQATIVIWGRLGSDDSLFPNFTLLRVLEIAGSLEQPELSTYYTPLSGQTVELGEELSVRTSVLTAFAIGLIHMADRDYEKAVRAFDRAISLAEESSGADVLYDYRGRSHIGLWKFEAALEDFQHALTLNPNNPSLYVDIGNIFYHQQDWPQAVAMYQQALDIRPDYVRAYQGLGATSAIQGNYQQAIQYYKQAIALKEDYALAYCSLGGAHHRLGNQEEAVTALEKCLKFVGANEALKTAAERNLSIIKQLLTVTPTFTFTPSPTPTATHTPTLTPTSTATPTFTPVHLATPIVILSTNTPTPTSIPTSTPTLTPTATSIPYPSPQLKYPSDGIITVGRFIRFEWSWEGTLGPDEYFDLKIRPHSDPNSIFVDWSKEPAYILDGLAWRLEESKTYVWTIQVIQGHYEGETKVLDGYLSPESEGFVIHRGTEHPDPIDPSGEGSGGGGGGSSIGDLGD